MFPTENMFLEFTIVRHILIYFTSNTHYHQINCIFTFLGEGGPSPLTGLSFSLVFSASCAPFSPESFSPTSSFCAYKNKYIGNQEIIMMHVGIGYIYFN